ncbi:hypothetical protein OB920_15625 [Halobacteria archaeon HArc-gm2]|nr:hypothetical protein [Halobacteria archaeon HArc-gm2]
MLSIERPATVVLVSIVLVPALASGLAVATGPLGGTDRTVGVDERTRIPVTLDEAPAGIQRYNVTVRLENDDVAAIESASGGDIGAFQVRSRTADSVTFRAADLGQTVQPGATNVTLATVTVRSTAPGMSTVSYTVHDFRTDDSEQVSPAVQDGTLTVRSDGGDGGDDSDEPSQSGNEENPPVGQSRSGKTYGCSKAAARWFMESDDHTLIVCDTQAGFEGVTEQLGGRHYVVDGSKTINPLDIQPVPEYVRESVGQVNPYQMKVNEATQFFAGVLKSQGVDPGSYTSTIEEGLEETYARFDIYPEDLDSHANESPTVADFLETLEDILEHPGEYTHTNHEREIERKVARVSDLLDKLSGFKPSGKYSYLVGQTEESLTDPDLDMAYLDLRQFRGSSDAEKSVMLQLMLGQVYEKVKRSRQKVVFLIDEAHVLLHSERMVTWLQKAAREWARYDAALWFVSQSPREFLSSMQGHAAAEESHRRTIVDQCSTVQCYRTPSVEPEILRELGLNSTQIQFVKRKATPGKAAAGHSECLIKLDDYQSWIPTYVEASPFEDTVLQYSRREHGDYSEYVERVLRGNSEGSPTVTRTNDRISDQRQRTSNGKSDTERRGPESDSRNPTQP